jgi:prepilin-type N-terminal cleavage/methylation domain-containing protein
VQPGNRGVKANRHHKRGNKRIRRTSARAAFTLIEFVIVLLIMAIAAGLIIPNAAPQTEQQLRAAAHLIAAEIELARDLAITYNSQYKLTFDTKNNRIVLVHTGGNSALNTLPQDLVNNPASDSTHRIIDLSTVPGLWGQVQIAACAEFRTTLTANSEIIFGPTGDPANGKSFLVWLKAGQGQWTRYITVFFDQSTGQVFIGSMNGVPPPF